MKASYGGHSTPSRAPVLLGIMAVATAGHMAIYDWGDFKVSKMLAAYPDKPRTVEHSGVLYNTHLKSQLAKAKQRITELSAQDIPEDRETIEEEKERWQEQREHLIEHVAQLEARLKESEEKLRRVLDKARHEELNDEDSAFVASLAGGGES